MALRGFLGGSLVRNLPANAEDIGLILGPGRSPGEGSGNPLQYSCLENPHGQRSLAGYPWGRKESDTTEQQQNGSESTFFRTVFWKGLR